jgi:hypothetical protein
LIRVALAHTCAKLAFKTNASILIALLVIMAEAALESVVVFHASEIKTVIANQVCNFISSLLKLIGSA